MNDLRQAFPGQEENEPVYVFARCYPVSFLPTACIFFVVFVFSLIAQFALSAGSLGTFSSDQVNAGILFFGAFQLFTLIIFLIAVLDFYFDIVILTDRRLVDIDQEMLFFRRISELSLSDVEDVTSVTNGLLATAFNYGRVEVQTAGARENFIMDNVRFPREIAAITLDLSEQAAKGVPEEERVPESAYVAVVDNRLIGSIDDLKSIGALLPSDLRRVKRNAA